MDLAKQVFNEAGKVFKKRTDEGLSKVTTFFQNPSDELKAVVTDHVLKLVSKDDELDDRVFRPTHTFQMIAQLDLKNADKLSGDIFMSFWNDIPHLNRQYPANSFRDADGSNNQLTTAGIGASNTPFARTVTTAHYPMKSELPDAGALFDDLLKRPDESVHPFEANVSGVNSLLFAFASVITHDIFRTKPSNPLINQTTSYVDLSCLYGANAEEQAQVRSGVNGLLKPDVFSDPRLQFQVPAVVFLLVLFCRNHNYIAQQLLSEEVNGKQENYCFTNVAGKDSPKLSAARTDELVFQTARNINVACYANVIFNEYLRSILNIDVRGSYSVKPNEQTPKDASRGNVVSAEFGYIYRWHSAISKQDAEWLSNIPLSKYLQARKKFMVELGNAEANNDEVSIQQAQVAHGKDMAALLPEFGITKQDMELGPLCIGYHRNPTTRQFSSSDLHQILTSSMDWVSCKMGARKIPGAMKDIEIEGIEGARKLGLCTLNEFRQHFRLKPYQSYAELLTGPQSPNPDPTIIAALEKHYGKDGIDKVEFYPGIVLEAIDADGISLPFSMARSILSDAVNLVKNDRFLVYGLNPHELTHWGYEYFRKSGDERTDGPVFKKIVLNCFPEWDIPEFAHRLEDPFHIIKK
ncbi:UNVERIFIED_CONTAM: hypothetical protein HDU68_010433 [Siphonaria sp. JEL0065]|nr:hypothetical protein HDU68_010433 [Siphonaria sp. JEL0065]